MRARTSPACTTTRAAASIVCTVPGSLGATVIVAAARTVPVATMGAGSGPRVTGSEVTRTSGASRNSLTGQRPRTSASTMLSRAHDRRICLYLRQGAAIDYTQVVYKYSISVAELT